MENNRFHEIISLQPVCHYSQNRYSQVWMYLSLRWLRSGMTGVILKTLPGTLNIRSLLLVVKFSLLLWIRVSSTICYIWSHFCAIPLWKILHLSFLTNPHILCFSISSHRYRLPWGLPKKRSFFLGHLLSNQGNITDQKPSTRSTAPKGHTQCSWCYISGVFKCQAASFVAKWRNIPVWRTNGHEAPAPEINVGVTRQVRLTSSDEDLGWVS